MLLISNKVKAPTCQVSPSPPLHRLSRKRTLGFEFAPIASVDAQASSAAGFHGDTPGAWRKSGNSLAISEAITAGSLCRASARSWPSSGDINHAAVWCRCFAMIRLLLASRYSVMSDTMMSPLRGFFGRLNFERLVRLIRHRDIEFFHGLPPVMVCHAAARQMLRTVAARRRA